MAGKTYNSPTATPGRRYTVIAKEFFANILCNFNANDRVYNFNANDREFNFNANSKTFNFNAKTGI